MKKIILASQSPRRHELLDMVGIEHAVITSYCDENIVSDGPADMVLKLSEIKAEGVAKNLSGDLLVIGSDTIVYFNGEVLGKPKNSEDAFRMITELPEIPTAYLPV